MGKIILGNERIGFILINGIADLAYTKTMPSPNIKIMKEYAFSCILSGMKFERCLLWKSEEMIFVHAGVEKSIKNVV